MSKKIDAYICGDYVNGIEFIRHTSTGTKRKAVFKCPECLCEWETRFDKVKAGDALMCRSCRSKKSFGAWRKTEEFKKHVEKYRVSNNNSAKNKAFRRIKKSAKERCKSFNLTKELVLDMIVKDCFYCGSKPNQIKFIDKDYPFMHHGLDRKNNAIGYEVGNVVQCCITCNTGKGSMLYSDWINHLDLLVKYRKSL